MPELIGQRVGNYQIKEKIGEGGMGSVFLAVHSLIGKKVAVKVLLDELAAKPDVVARFIDEAKAVSAIGHQNIVDFVDFGEVVGESGSKTVYFIMEFLVGDPLSKRIQEAPPSLQDSMKIMKQCCSALSASHGQGIVHRDLKPENLFLCIRGSDRSFVKILDFGIAKLTGSATSSSQKTRTGTVIGTPAYMSPEQCEGKGNIDHRSDIYSLGIVMYQLLAGQVPFPGEGFGEILVAHLTREPPPMTSINPSVSPELESIVMHAIEKDKNRRFQSMEEFEAALENPAQHFTTYQPLPGYSAPLGGPSSMMRAPTGSLSAAMPVSGATGTGVRVPTTLSGAAVSIDGSPDGVPRSNKTPLYAAVGVLAAVGLSVAGYAVFGGSKKAPVAAVAPMPSSPVAAAVSAPSKNKVKLTTNPEGALLTVEGTKTHFTAPHEFELSKDDAPIEVSITLDGYAPAKRTLTGERDHEVAVSLTKVEAAHPATPVATGSSAPSSSSSRRSSRPKAASKGSDDDMTLLQPKF
jgi:serine/threonine-protein kinase